MKSPITTDVKIFLAVPILPGSPPAVKNITPPTTIIKIAKGNSMLMVKKSTILLNKTKKWQRVQGQHSQLFVQGSLQPLPQGTRPPLSSGGQSPPKEQGHTSGQVQVQVGSQSGQSPRQLVEFSPTAELQTPFPQQSSTVQSSGQLLHSPPATSQVPLPQGRTSPMH